jgi:hypothetical protein
VPPATCYSSSHLLIQTLWRVSCLSRREFVVLVLLFGASLPAVTTRLYSSDEVQYFAYLRSLWFDHDVSFENEYRYFYDHDIAQSAGFHETFLERKTAAGRRVNYGTMGCAVLWAPFYAIGDAAARVMRAAGRDVAVDGFSKPYVVAVAFGSAFWGFAAILLSIAAARRITGRAGSIAAGIAVWLGTPLLFYMYVAPPFSHACSAFAVALFVTVWLHVRGQWSVGGVVALGLSAALVAMVREQDIFFLAGPAVDFGLTAGRMLFVEGAGKRATGKVAITAIAGCAVFAIGYLPQLLAYNALNGGPWPASDVQRKMTWYSPHALQVLASPEHGFLFWTPLAVLSLAGLVALRVGWRGLKPDGTSKVRLKPDTTEITEDDRRRIGACALLMVALQVYISGVVESWTVAGAFGQRRFVCLTILLVIGLAALLSSLSTVPRRAVAVLTALTVWWNLALIAEFSTQLMDRQRLELKKNAYDAFVTIPRMAPGLAYRYLTRRETFYKPRPASGTER